ncbi:MAG: DNA-3-methyladenine glycosylase I [Candidatus Micrarchaeota archaeon]|nr:DNA-3-methyladenine glycosylase I [Candidatus Micrarchaeota archaeon]MDE1834231.1 DNA-3-methyladenine glycosylase I [Candidatus Micrarchaeota archaeon]MDE1859298.1 DNA-3-methyladenine glycosylase I [Candidatus Micrarchaeota archaeon]
MEIKKRCDWSTSLQDQMYLAYHDQEWGVPVHDDRVLFEFLTLEGAQAGLSWSTVLKKRENYRNAFDKFDPRKVARYDSRKVSTLLSDPGIIRNRLKINSAINNAIRFIEIQKEFGSFDDYIWGFMPGNKPRTNNWTKMSQVPAKTPESDRISADLINRGFKFVGSTICYAHMQATGMVNDHLVSCFRHNEV